MIDDHRAERDDDESSVWLTLVLDVAGKLERKQAARQAEQERHEQNARAVAWWQSQRHAI